MYKILNKIVLTTPGCDPKIPFTKFKSLKSKAKVEKMNFEVCHKVTFYLNTPGCDPKILSQSSSRLKSRQKWNK